MKTLHITLLAAAAMLFAACESYEFIDSQKNNTDDKRVLITFMADVVQNDPQTRTTLAEDGLSVHWTEGDKIAVWTGTGSTTSTGEYGNEFIAGNIDGNKATFTGTAEESDIYIAFYPYNLERKAYSDYFKFYLPTVQKATAGTFATGSAPSWAMATGSNKTLEFRNLCALVKFTVGNDMAGKGIFTFVGGTANERLAGNGFTYYYKEDKLTPPYYNDSSSRITLSGTFEAGQTYYIVVAPCELANGFSLLYEDPDGRLYRKATDKALNLTAGHILNLGQMETSGFEKAVRKELYEAIMLNTSGTPDTRSTTYTYNADGTVTLSESDLTALAAVTELDLSNKDLTSIGGIGYYTGLKKLNCSNNYRLKELNISGLTELTELDCNKCYAVAELDLSKLTKLTKLNCRYLDLEELDVNSLNELTELDCGQNHRMNKLRISGLGKLAKLDCSMGGLAELQLDGLDGLKELWCYENTLTTLDVRCLTGLARLECWQNYNMTNLNVSGLSQLETLSCWACSIYGLNLDGLTNLKTLYCELNHVSALDITGQILLENLRCGSQSADGDKGGGEPLTLTLTLTPEQETKWNNSWKNTWENDNVILNIIPAL